MTHRFILEPYKDIASRHTCPECKHRRYFSRYIDTEKHIHFPEHVGRCDREQKCGYHFTRKELTQAPEAVLNPGDARVEVNIGKTVTTYATSADELLIKNSLYALYGATISKIDIDPVEGTPVSKINFTVSVAHVTANPNATLVVVANTANFTSNGGAKP